MENLEKQFIHIGDVQLHVVTAGTDDGEPVFLLHGFPEFWYGWKHQIPFLAENGYRVVVPDQRGYNLSDKPKGVANYAVDILTQDVINLANTLGYEKIYLVGHDWGGVVAWWTATIFPDRLKKLVILNVPHPYVFLQQYRQGNIMQWLKSWYVGFFQVPFIPEALMSLGDYSLMEQAIRRSARRTTFTDEDIENYRRAWSQPHALTSMLNWYRAMSKSIENSNIFKERRISVPTLMLWGENDVALGKELAQPSIELCDDGALIFYPNATHWVQHDEADNVNREIHNFIS